MNRASLERNTRFSSLLIHSHGVRKEFQSFIQKIEDSNVQAQEARADFTYQDHTVDTRLAQSGSSLLSLAARRAAGSLDFPPSRHTRFDRARLEAVGIDHSPRTHVSRQDQNRDLFRKKEQQPNINILNTARHGPFL